MRSIPAVPITAEAYRPFGALVAADETRAPRTANHGAASAWDGLATLTSTRGPRAPLGASLFRCKPLVGTTLPVRWLERHAFSTQMFVPMNASRYLVVVAQGGDAPDLATLAAFVVPGGQAITYAPGIWHHPMVALDREADFVNVVASAGDAEDCEEQSFDVPAVTIDVPGGVAA